MSMSSQQKAKKIVEDWQSRGGSNRARIALPPLDRDDLVNAIAKALEENGQAPMVGSHESETLRAGLLALRRAAEDEL